jgi:quinol monooxygenase YgiN
MIRKILLPFGCILALVACATETPPEPAETTEAPEATEPASGPSLLALHLYNPASDDAHQQFLTGLGELSAAVASVGHPETRYRVWKVAGEQAGDHGHLFGSVWADRATYDAVHEHDDYKAVMAKLEDSGLEALEGEIYNKYTLQNPSTPPASPMPDATYLSVHVFNLASAEAENELVGILEEFNGAISEAGYPQTRYGVWKVSGDQAGDHAYLSGSLWADRAAYDAAHEYPSYKALSEKHGDALEKLIPEEIYNKYELVQ